MRIFFVTSNEAKFREASLVLKEFGIDLMINRGYRKVEIQSDNLEDIVNNALQFICGDNSSDYFVVEDDGLFINRLNGFPGPYSSYVYKTIGLIGILKLMSGVDDRTAYFKSVVGLCGPKVGIKLFSGVVYGRIAMEPRGGTEGGFGFDPIFIPEGYDKTFAELGIDIKNKLSHRARAFRPWAIGY
ncbi:XTP/dITP diphosphatase [Vulcanisaeta distributa]|uniref:XTP/dITP diphosphatase n=1 Tax=Vulcanisaeta distributa TaxID=164451 RepID=UPI0006D155AA|nr:XTP/dITP diphosphatase [Vulcanisaeta distributa]